jgi:hypothetical protein
VDSKHHTALCYRSSSGRSVVARFWLQARVGRFVEKRNTITATFSPLTHKQVIVVLLLLERLKVI